MAKHYINQCKECRRTFPSKRNDALFCSKECLAKYKKNKENFSPIPCVICGNTFKPKSVAVVYCSKECRDKWRIKRRRIIREQEKTCPHCSQKFTTMDSRQKYCSPRCQARYNIEKKKRIFNRLCLYCKTPFTTNKPKGKYCTEDCGKKYRNEKAKKDRERVQRLKTKEKANCKYCGKEFEKIRTDNKYCSKECCGKYARERERERYRQRLQWLELGIEEPIRGDAKKIKCVVCDNKFTIYIGEVKVEPIVCCEECSTKLRKFYTFYPSHKEQLAKAFCFDVKRFNEKVPTLIVNAKKGAKLLDIPMWQYMKCVEVIKRKNKNE